MNKPEYKAALLAVRDMQASKWFYTQLLDMQITTDYGENIVLDECVALQTLDTWAGFLGCAPPDIRFGGRSFELFFEIEDLDAFADKLKHFPDVEKVREVEEYPWGQRVLRLYDPDRHIVEIGESMQVGLNRMFDAGLSDEEAKAKSQQTMEFVLACRQEWQAKK